MTWVRIDDRALLHPKLLAAGPDGVTLWLAGLCYCNAHHTDGRIPSRALAALYPSDEWTRARMTRAAERLVTLGAWHAEDVGWLVHGYAEYQEEALRENVEERRKYERERKRAQRDAKRGKPPPNKSGPDEPLSRRDSPGHDAGTGTGQPVGHVVGQVRDTHGTGAVDSRATCPSPPTRPDPTRPDPITSPTETDRDMSADGSSPPVHAQARGDVLAVFDRWRERLGKTAAARLDKKRRARIEWALAQYGLEAVMRCIDGYAASAWHRGQNDRGQVYDDLTLWLRDAEHVERGIAMANGEGRRASGRLPPIDVDAESARESQRRARELFGGGPPGEVANG